MAWIISIERNGETEYMGPRNSVIEIEKGWMSHRGNAFRFKLKRDAKFYYDKIISKYNPKLIKV